MPERKKVFKGDRLREIRNQRGITQEELNNRLGFGPTQVHRYETGQADPSPDVLVRIARELEVTTDYLLGLVSEPTDHLAEQSLTATERKLLSAYRRGDWQELMRVASKESDAEPND
jgi:transcriptional regulator with XRE-family HTH domain